MTPPLLAHLFDDSSFDAAYLFNSCCFARVRYKTKQRRRRMRRVTPLEAVVEEEPEAENEKPPNRNNFKKPVFKSMNSTDELLKKVYVVRALSKKNSGFGLATTSPRPLFRQKSRSLPNQSDGYENSRAGSNRRMTLFPHEVGLHIQNLATDANNRLRNSINRISMSLAQATGSHSSTKVFRSWTSRLVWIYFYLQFHRVGYYWGRVSNFNQAESRKQCFIASDWLKFETLPLKYHTLYFLTIIMFS